MARTALFLSPGAELAPAVALARRADTLGYESLWVTHGIGRDALQVLAAYGNVAPHAGLGSGVIPIYPRHPVLLAQEALTLSDVSGGRLRLGIGVSHKPMMEGALGLDMGRPLEVTREYVTVLRAALTGRVQHEGPRYRVNWQSGLPRVPAAPPILLGGLAPRMLELAGEIADGVVLNWIPPETVPASIKHLEAGAKKAGRGLTDFEIASFIRTCVTDDPAAAREALARDITGYTTVDAYASFFRNAGFGEEVDAVNTAWRAGDRSGAVKQVSPRFLDGLGVVGPEAFCRERIAEFARAGLTQPVIVPFAPGSAGEARAAQLRTLRTFP